MSDEDDFNARAADLVLETHEEYQERQAEHEAFLETVAEEEGAETLTTECNLIGEYTVPLEAKLNGEIMDRMEALDDRIQRLSAGEARVSDTADEVAQLLADLIADPEWDKRKFYAAYEREGLDPLGVMLERTFESLKEERERRRGTADGFRSE